MEETSLLIMKLWRSAGAESTWVVLSAQRYVNGLFSWWCSRDAALRMSSNQRASLSLRAAFDSSKNAWQEELKETTINAHARVKKKTMKQHGRTIGDSGTLSKGLSPMLASRVKWQFHPAST